MLVALVSGLKLPGHWIGEAGPDAGFEPVAIPDVMPTGHNGGALPASAKLDSAQ